MDISTGAVVLGLFIIKALFEDIIVKVIRNLWSMTVEKVANIKIPDIKPYKKKQVFKETIKERELEEILEDLSSPDIDSSVDEVQDIFVYTDVYGFIHGTTDYYTALDYSYDYNVYRLKEDGINDYYTSGGFVYQNNIRLTKSQHLLCELEVVF